MTHDSFPGLRVLLAPVLPVHPCLSALSSEKFQGITRRPNSYAVGAVGRRGGGPNQMMGRSSWWILGAITLSILLVPFSSPSVRGHLLP